MLGGSDFRLPSGGLGGVDPAGGPVPSSGTRALSDGTQIGPPVMADSRAFWM